MTKEQRIAEKQRKLDEAKAAHEKASAAKRARIEAGHSRPKHAPLDFSDHTPESLNNRG